MHFQIHFCLRVWVCSMRTSVMHLSTPQKKSYFCITESEAQVLRHYTISSKSQPIEKLSLMPKYMDFRQSLALTWFFMSLCLLWLLCFERGPFSSLAKLPGVERVWLKHFAYPQWSRMFNQACILLFLLTSLMWASLSEISKAVDVIGNFLNEQRILPYFVK